MAAKKVTVLTLTQSQRLGMGEDDLEPTKEALRRLRPLGVRFSVEEVDGADTTVSAWIEEREPKERKTRQALGSTGAAAPPGSATAKAGDE